MIQEDSLVLKRLNLCFWGIWLFVPLLVGVFINHAWTAPYVMLDGVETATTIPSFFSFKGQVLVAIELLFNVVLYLALVALMHRLVGRFAIGQAMIVNTLHTMQIIAWLLLASACIGELLSNLNMFLLFRLGDIPSWEPIYFIDLKDLALSLTLFALRILIRHAIVLKEDNDLTV